MVFDRISMDRCRAAAVDRLIEGVEGQRKHGILVTPGDGHFKVGLSNTVPYSNIRQLDLRRQKTDAE